MDADDPTAEALLAEVYADPDADQPRLVYADWCLAHGEPHGELVVLQMARRARAPKLESVVRERELVATHRHRWLAQIWDALDQPSPRFERGFLAHVKAGGRYHDRAARPEWSTVTSLELPADRDRALAIAGELARDPTRLPVLREIRRAPLEALVRLATRTRIEHIGSAEHPDAFSRFVMTDRFPSLRSLGITGTPADWNALWEHPLGARIERLEIAGPFYAKSPWLVPGRQLPPTLRELELRLPDGSQLRFERTGDSFSRVDIVARGYSAEHAVYSALHVVPASLLRDITISVPDLLPATARTRLEMHVHRAQRLLEHYRLRLVP